MMFDKPGIGPEDLAWIERDPYVYYVEMAHHLGDPAATNTADGYS